MKDLAVTMPSEYEFTKKIFSSPFMGWHVHKIISVSGTYWLEIVNAGLPPVATRNR